jgi:hypothetical protein
MFGACCIAHCDLGGRRVDVNDRGCQKSLAPESAIAVVSGEGEIGKGLVHRPLVTRAHPLLGGRELQVVHLGRGGIE